MNTNCTLEQAKKLKEHGFPGIHIAGDICLECGKSKEKGFHAYYGNDYDAGKHDYEQEDNILPSVAKIMEELKDKIYSITWYEDTGWNINGLQCQNNGEVYMNKDLLTALVEAYCKIQSFKKY